MPETITLPKTEYERLRKMAEQYKLVQNAIKEDFFEEPPVTDPKEIIRAFKETGRYNKAFLDSLARGLKQSVFLKAAKAC